MVLLRRVGEGTLFMAKSKTVFICQTCGWNNPRWAGQCPSCQEWNTLVEEVVESAKSTTKEQMGVVLSQHVLSFTEVAAAESGTERISTGIHEFDRVLGGTDGHTGMVPGGVYLIGGEPGIGKSTLLTQVVLARLRGQKPETTRAPILYVCGEESPSQISLRINRIKKKEEINLDLLKFVTTTDVDAITALFAELKPQLVVVDSIQSVTTSDLAGAAGSIGQIREATERLTRAAKLHKTPLFLVGHVTKEGTISGPKVLEHIVDSVLELSGERTSEVRLLRAIKNRFGATDEVGVFQVAESGYVEVTNPSTFFIEADQGHVPGSVVICIMEGTRPLLVEVQALVVPSQLPVPRRVGRGVDTSRIQVLAAVLQKHGKLSLANHDVFVSIAGGLSIKEPAADVGIALALASSLTNKPLAADCVAIGEVGLLGELRGVSLYERRVKESKRLGYSKILSKEKFKTLSLLLQALNVENKSRG